MVEWERPAWLDCRKTPEINLLEIEQQKNAELSVRLEEATARHKEAETDAKTFAILCLLQFGVMMAIAGWLF